MFTGRGPDNDSQYHKLLFFKCNGHRPWNPELPIRILLHVLERRRQRSGVLQSRHKQQHDDRLHYVCPLRDDERRYCNVAGIGVDSDLPDGVHVYIFDGERFERVDR
jgi:hypothetical protein